MPSRGLASLERQPRRADPVALPASRADPAARRASRADAAVPAVPADPAGWAREPDLAGRPSPAEMLGDQQFETDTERDGRGRHRDRGHDA
jgi:hypothetical protein